MTEGVPIFCSQVSETFPETPGGVDRSPPFCPFGAIRGPVTFPTLEFDNGERVWEQGTVERKRGAMAGAMFDHPFAGERVRAAKFAQANGLPSELVEPLAIELHAYAAEVRESMGERPVFSPGKKR